MRTPKDPKPSSVEGRSCLEPHSSQGWKVFADEHHPGQLTSEMTCACGRSFLKVQALTARIIHVHVDKRKVGREAVDMRSLNRCS